MNAVHKLLIDECVDESVFPWALVANHQIVRVRTILLGAADMDVLRYAREQGCVLITEDRDYGGLIFQHRMAPPIGIVYVALAGLAQSERKVRLHICMQEALANIVGHFIVIGPQSIRIRDLTPVLQ